MFKQSSYRPMSKKNRNYSGLLIVLFAILIIAVGYFAADGIIGVFNNSSKSIKTNNSNISSQVSSEVNINNLQVLPNEIRGIYVPISTLSTSEGQNSIIALSKKTEINTIVVDVKGEDGKLNYNSTIPLAVSANAVNENSVDFKEINQKLKTAGIYVIARVVTFKDGFLPKFNSKYSVQLSGGGKWWNAFFWTNPYNEEVTDYLYSICDEVSTMGFNEIMLDEVKFPDNGRLELLDYGEISKTISKPKMLNDFVNTFSDKAHNKGLKVSLCIPGQGAFSETVNVESGQTFDLANLKVDYLSPRFQVSTLKTAYSNSVTINDKVIENAENNPSEVVKTAISETLNRMNSLNCKAILRPFIGDYDSASKVYTAEDIKAQINACKDAKCGIYLAWNDKGVYREEAYVK